MKPPQQQRGNGEGVLLSRKIFSSLFIALIVSLGLACFYYGASFAPALRRLDHPTADGSDPFFRHFIAASEEPPSFSRDGAELVVKSFRVLSFSLLIPRWRRTSRDDLEERSLDGWVGVGTDDQGSGTIAEECLADEAVEVGLSGASEGDSGDLGADDENAGTAVVLGEVLGEAEHGAAGSRPRACRRRWWCRR